MRKWLLSVALLGLVYGCNNTVLPPDGDPGPGSGRPEVPGLRTFASESEMNDYLMGQVAAQAPAMRLEGAPPPGLDEGALTEADGVQAAPGAAPAGDAALSAGGGAGDADHSGTTIQEAGVDEADVVKTDGVFLYVLTNDWNTGGSILKVVRAAPLEVVSETRLPGYGNNLYLHGDKIVALTEVHGYSAFPTDIGPIVTLEDGAVADSGVSTGSGIAIEPLPPVQIEPGAGGGDDGEQPGDGDVVVDGDFVAPDIGIDFAPPVFVRPRTAVTIFDMADRAAPRQLGEYRFDGWQSSSRMIDGVLRLVVSNFQYYYFDVLPLMGRPGADFSQVHTADLIPKYSYTDANGQTTTGDVTTWRETYHPETEDGFGVTSLVTLDVDSSSTFKAISIVAEPGLVYSTTSAMYLTNTKYDYTGELRSNTNIYKIEYTADNAVATATGSVPGRVLNQYSMGEHNDDLRVATTIDPIWSPDGQVTEPSNNVYVLDEVDGTLVTIGRIENVAPGETIQSARFLGDRGYLVTFEQVDPLFTLDLSNPSSPRIVGELKVPGFSTFIVPMDANHILTVGEYIPEVAEGEWFRDTGVQLSIFDVTDFANPVLEHNVVIGGAEQTSAYSEALWNPKAFTYFAEQGLVALPISIQYNAWVDDAWGDEVTVIDGDDGVGINPPADLIDDVIEDPGAVIDPWLANSFDGLMVYRVSVDGGISEAGRISTRFEDQSWLYPSFTRGVFIGNDVYAVTDGGVKSAAVDSAGTVTSEIFYGPVLPPWEDVWVDDGIAVDGEIAPGIAVR